MSELKLQTPEGVSFSFLLASPFSRMLAFVVDGAAITVTAQALSLGAGLMGLISVDLARAFVILSYFVTSILYGILLEYAWRGQTLGKRLFRLRVIDRQGLRLSFPQVALRNLLRFVDMLPFCYFVGGAFCLATKRFQRLGDIAANTVVVRQPRMAQPDLSAVVLPKFNSLKQYPHLVARLRQRLSPMAAGVLFEAILRRDEFEPAARVELFGELAEYCRSLVAFPPEAMESIADEQIVRNVIDVVFEKARPD